MSHGDSPFSVNLMHLAITVLPLKRAMLAREAEDGVDILQYKEQNGYELRGSRAWWKGANRQDCSTLPNMSPCLGASCQHILKTVKNGNFHEVFR